MKLPLTFKKPRHGDVRIIDATGAVVMIVLDSPSAEKIAKVTVRKFNRWKWISRAVEYARDDWLMEKNTWRPS